MFYHRAIVVRVHVRRLLSIFLLLVIGVLTEDATYAAIFFTGNVDPNPAAWNGATEGYIGKTTDGMLTVNNGSDLLSNYAYFGDAAGVVGVVNVDGAGSTWNNNERLFIGNSGSGILNITNGGSVSAVVGWLGYQPDSNGTMTVSGAGSTWTTSFYLFIGGSGKGTLTITNGGRVQNNSLSYIGDEVGSNGTVTVSDTGSIWASDSIRVGSAGTGTLKILNGAVVTDNYTDISVGGTGIAIVDGVGSTWINKTSLTIGTQSTGVGKMIVRGGGSVSNADGHIGQQPSKIGSVTVVGTGSKWTNTVDLDVGQFGQGTLNVVGGGTVTTGTLSINSQSLLAIDVGCGSSLTVGSGFGTIANQGKLRVLAGASAATGATFNPILSGVWTGSGMYQGVGGKLNASNRLFTVSDIQSGIPGTSVTIDLSQKQRIFISDGPNSWSLGSSFLAKTSSSSLTFAATPISDGPLTSLGRLLESGDGVLGGWALSTTEGYAAGDPAYLSFGIGSGHSLDDLLVWQYTGGSWTKYDANDLTYDSTYASFVVTGMGTYAVTGIAVPEPSTIALLGMGSIGLLAWAWRRRRKA